MATTRDRPRANATGQHPDLQRAIAFFRDGALRDAASLVDPILERQPDDVTALHLAGMIAYRRRDVETAEARLQKAAGLSPDNPGLLNDLGTVLTQAEKFAGAERALVRALELLPNTPGFHLNLGKVYKAMAMYEAAEKQVRAAIYYKRDYAEAYRVLSEILSEDGRTDDAIAMAETAARLAPKDPRSLVRLGEALNADGRIEPARAAFENAIELVPDSVELLTRYGAFLSERGFLDEAAALTRDLLVRFPQAIGVHAVLAQTVKFTHFNDEMATMEALLKRDDIGERDRMSLHFGLAKACEDIGDYATAFSHSLAGNAIARKEKRYSAERSDREFELLQTAFTPDLIDRLGASGCMDDTPIFVLGMPRSGTTLAEQILASHGMVHGAGELTLFGSLLRELHDRLDLAEKTDLLARATPDDWRELGERYVDRLRRLAPDARHIVDKMPDNFLHLGFIRLALPKAKIVYCRRLAPDNCISIFNLRFATSGLGYGYDLTELGRYYRKHARLMAHWSQLMPGFFFTNQYEEMVADQQPQTRRLIEFCGLDWDDRVLDFFASERAVRTASVTQVRRPIYTTSVGRYKRYGAAVQPLLEALAWDEASQSVQL